MVGMAWTSRPAGSGLGFALASTLSTPAALAALAQGILAAFVMRLRAGAVILVGAFVIVRFARTYFYARHRRRQRRLPGRDGTDCSRSSFWRLLHCTVCGWA